MPLLPRRFALTTTLALLSATAASAQDGPTPLPTVDQQIAASVIALPKNMRAGATVMGYRTRDKLVVIRKGTNGMTCLALFAVRPK